MRLAKLVRGVWAQGGAPRARWSVVPPVWDAKTKPDARISG
jgi:hypothetical protein